MPASSADGCYDVFFDPLSTRAESRGDQAFGGRLYCNDVGEIALTVDLQYLLETDVELMQLKAAKVNWTQIQDC